MSIPIHSLKWVIILCSLAYPLFFTEMISEIVSHIRKRETINPLYNPRMWVWGLILAYAVPLLVIYVDSPHLFFVNFPPSFFYGISVICVPVIVGVEFVVGYFIVYAKRRTLSRPRVSIHSSWQKVPLSTLVLSIVLVLEEELVFRQLWLYILTHYFAVPWAAAIGISSAVYALNHLTFGLNSIPQKFATGLFLGSMYYLSGSSLLVTIITHYVQNVALGLVGRWTT
jgi:hypothetical protein